MAGLDELAVILSAAMGVRFTSIGIRTALGGTRARGSSNYVVCVRPSLIPGLCASGASSSGDIDSAVLDRYSVALRVAHGKTNDDETEAERLFGAHAFERGFGLEPLFSGKVKTPRGTRGASCWPWGVCLCGHLGAIGAGIARALRRASETVLALDASAIRNHVLARGTWCLIDFDPYFTKVAETAEQRDASRGFVAVQMLLLRAQMNGLFSLRDIREAAEADEADRREEERSAAEADRREEDRREEERSADEAVEAAEQDRREEERSADEADEADRREEERLEQDRSADEVLEKERSEELTDEVLEVLASALVARIVRVAACFPDTARALACVVHMYGAYGMVGHVKKDARRAMADANKPECVDALLRAGHAEEHARFFVRAALGLVDPAAFEAEYTERFSSFFVAEPESAPEAAPVSL